MMSPVQIYRNKFVYPILVACIDHVVACIDHVVVCVQYEQL